MAIEDNYVRKNLFDFQLSEVIEDASKTKTALSKVQEADCWTYTLMRQMQEMRGLVA